MDILWTDIETTGLEERDGLLLELGLVITGPGPDFTERAAWSCVVGYPDIRSRIRDEFVRKMHEANGLLDEVERSTVTLAGLEAQACSWVERNEGEGLPMGGSSPQFDRRWLRVHAPKFAEVFHYRMVDVATIRILFGLEKPEGAHRAIQDLNDTIGTVRQLGPFLSPEARVQFLAASASA